MHTHDLNSSNVPAFLIKLWKLVEDPMCDDLIAWSDGGISFIIRDQARFASELLPQYFKHNNMASFVRQLNMYGFRKVMNYEKSGLRTDNNEIEFQHAFFIKDQSELLELIKRKIPNARMIAEPHSKSNANDILTDLTSIRDKQESMDNLLLKMKQENELLWKELTNMRQKHKKQEEVIEKVIQFLVQIIRNQPVGVGIQRKMPRMLYDSSGLKGNSQQITTVDLLRQKPECIIIKGKKTSGPVIHEITDSENDDSHNIGSVKSPASAKSPVSRLSAKSPASVYSLSPAPTPSSDNGPTSPVLDCSLDAPNLDSPINSALPLEPLSILEPLQSSRTPEMKDDYEDDDSNMGIPLDYITTDVASALKAMPSVNVISFPRNSTAGNVISIKKGNDIDNVITIPEGNDIANVITIPEGSDLSNVITIPEGSDIGSVITKSDLGNVIHIPDSNVISIPEDSDIGNVISIPEDGDISNIIALSSKSSKKVSIPCSTAATSVQNASAGASSKKNNRTLTFPNFFDATPSELKTNMSSNPPNPVNACISENNYNDPLMSDSLHTPQISLTDDILADFSLEDSSFKDNSTTEVPPALTLSQQQQQDCPASTSSTSPAKSSTAKNTLSNHLLIVDEELNRLQDNIATNQWDVDVDKILGLFSSDGIVSNEAIVDQLTNGISIKKEPDDILGSELEQLAPQILGVELDELRSPFLNHLDPEVICVDKSNKVTPLLDVTSNEEVLDISEFLSNDPGVGNKRRKTSKLQSKGKRHKSK